MNTDKALTILPFVGVLERDNTGRPTVIQTPAQTSFTKGLRGRPRVTQVELSRPNPDTVIVKCTHYDACNMQDKGSQCPATASGYVCYHAIAAMLATANEVNADCRLFTHQPEALETLGQQRGRVVTIRCGRAEVYACVTARPEPTKPTPPPATETKPTPPVPTPPPVAVVPASVAPLVLFTDAPTTPEPTAKRRRKPAKSGK